MEFPENETPAHEGDSIIFMRLLILAQNATTDIQKALIREKADIAYQRHAIIQEQWGDLYAILGWKTPEKNCVYPTAQTKLNQRHGIE